MAKVIPLRQALIGMLAMLASLAVLFFGNRWSDTLLHSSGPPGARWLGVALAVVSIVPWIYCLAWGVAAGDEYVQHIALVGTALAFVLDLLAHVAFNTMVDARLLAPSSYLPELAAAIACWVVGCAIAMLYYRQRP